MIVKVKHTKNGNVKITMSLEQAERLRQRAYTTFAERDKLNFQTISFLDELDDRLGLADIWGRI